MSKRWSWSERVEHGDGPCDRAVIVTHGVFVPTSGVVQSCVIRDLVVAVPAMLRFVRYVAVEKSPGHDSKKCTAGIPKCDTCSARALIEKIDEGGA